MRKEITFIDHNTGVVLNGSRLGKEYAANAIIDRLENPHQYEHLTNNPQPQSSAQFTPQQQPRRRGVPPKNATQKEEREANVMP